MGPPVSHQTKNAVRLQQWKAEIAAAARQTWPIADEPEGGVLQMTVIYYHDGPSARLDNDNMVKPIQDALINVIYVDDGQITDIRVRKTDINGKFVVRHMSPTLAQAFMDGEEFLFIRVEAAPDHGVLP
ncbi:MAG TPA: RusA family crossover junction endodeoxyribonuclease [Candidatus Angelobacter sp.]|nr:RusA family crossover junction endodeoxyribonuclease [Candidatus Angelobacter sp.]